LLRAAEEIRDLDGPIVLFWCVVGRLEDNGFGIQIGKPDAVDRVVVGRHDLPLRRRHVVVEIPHHVFGCPWEESQGGAGPRALHHLPAAGATERVDGGIAPVVDDARERLDVSFVGQSCRHAGGIWKIRMCGVESARSVRRG
jgi:hypothetical protein